jgi:hypothetical protein
MSFVLFALLLVQEFSSYRESQSSLEELCKCQYLQESSPSRIQTWSPSNQVMPLLQHANIYYQTFQYFGIAPVSLRHHAVLFQVLFKTFAKGSQKEYNTLHPLHDHFFETNVSALQPNHLCILFPINFRIRGVRVASGWGR